MIVRILNILWWFWRWYLNLLKKLSTNITIFEMKLVANNFLEWKIRALVIFVLQYLDIWPNNAKRGLWGLISTVFDPEICFAYYKKVDIGKQKFNIRGIRTPDIAKKIFTWLDTTPWMHKCRTFPYFVNRSCLL